MDLNQRVTQLFVDSIETKQHSIERLSPLISSAGELLVSTLIGDGKILVCGGGSSNSIAQIFASQLLNQFERERPSLPTIHLQIDTHYPTLDNHQVFAKQINALGKAEDTLLVLSTIGNDPALQEAIQAAHSRQCRVILLTGASNGDLNQFLTTEDMELRVPSSSPSRVLEVHQLIINCWCDLIDNLIFGELL